MQLKKFVQGLHRWLGLILVAQLTLWMASGVVMSLLPIEHVRGENAIAFEAPVNLEVQNYFPPAGVISEVDNAREVTLKRWLGRDVYLVRGENAAALFDADTGDRISPISEADARRVAAADFSGDSEIDRVRMLNKAPHEAGRPGPLWRVDFSDVDETRIYISPETGAVVARRNRVWRYYDFFWMLHIMDYEERENFNNPLVQTFALTGLLFAMSGLVLVITRLRSGRYLDDLRRKNKKAAD